MQIKNISFWDVNELGLDKIERCRRSLGTLVIQEDTSAIDVAKAVDALGEQAHTIVLVNTNDAVSGIFFPEEFRRKLHDIKGIDTDSLTQALIQLEQDPNEQTRNFQHEYLNLERPKKVWCGVGNHFARPPQCNKH